MGNASAFRANRIISINWKRKLELFVNFLQGLTNIHHFNAKQARVYDSLEIFSFSFHLFNNIIDILVTLHSILGRMASNVLSYMAQNHSSSLVFQKTMEQKLIQIF